MAEDRMALLDTLRKTLAGGDADFLREGVRVLAQALMEAEVTELTGVPRGERDPEARLTHRNGYRERRWDTRVGSIDLAIGAHLAQGLEQGHAVVGHRGVLRVVGCYSNDARMTRWPLSFTAVRCYTKSGDTTSPACYSSR